MKFFSYKFLVYAMFDHEIFSSDTPPEDMRLLLESLSNIRDRKNNKERLSGDVTQLFEMQTKHLVVPEHQQQ